jgi:hypothetical protein
LQTITDDLHAILKSKFQAAADGFRARVEIDTIVAGAPGTHGSAWNTATSYGRSVLTLADPSEAYAVGDAYSGIDASALTDADLGTTYGYGPGVAGAGTYRRGYVLDLGAPLVVSKFTVIGGAAAFAEVKAGDTNPPTSAVTGTWTPGDADGWSWTSPYGFSVGTFALDAPVTARYWYFGWVDVLPGLTYIGATEATAEILVNGVPLYSIVTTSYQVMRVSIDHSFQSDADAFEIELDNSDGSLNLSNPDTIALPGRRIRIFQWYGDPANEVQTFDGFIDKAAEHG